MMTTWDRATEFVWFVLLVCTTFFVVMLAMSYVATFVAHVLRYRAVRRTYPAAVRSSVWRHTR